MRRLLKKQIPFFIGLSALSWQLLFFYVPLFFIVAASFSEQVGYFSTYAFFLRPLYGMILLKSLALGLGTVLLCSLLAYPLAYFLVFRAGRYKLVGLFLLLVPFWTNFLLHMYAWFFVLEREGAVNVLLMHLGIIQEPLALLNNLFSVVIMMVYYYLPFMVLPLYSAFEKIDRRLFEASLDLGASWPQTMRRVLIPLTVSGLQSGVFLVFIPACAEFAIPELMGGDKYMFLGIVVSRYMLGVNTNHLGAAFTLISMLFLLVVALALRWGISRLVRAL